MWTIALVIFVVLTQEVHLQKSVRIDAAFRFGAGLYLLSGDEAMVLDSAGQQHDIRPRGNRAKIPATDYPFQAAIRWPHKGIVYFYGPESSYKVYGHSNTTALIPKKYGKTREFLQDGGPDAAAFKSKTFYIFKGCQFVAQRGTLWKLGEPRNNSELHLPCNIDAAWTDPDYNGMTVLKGDQIWHWTGEDNVIGPRPFAASYFMKDWKLEPYDSDTK